MADNTISMMHDVHFLLGKNKENRLSTSFLTGTMLTVSGKSYVNKGIKVPSGKIFSCSQQKNTTGIYVFEAGLAPGHAESLKENICIYITCGEKQILVGTLSPDHPSIQLNLMLAEDFELRHTAKRKTVFFNAYEFCPKPLFECLSHAGNFYSDTNFWAMEIKPSEKTRIHPKDEDKKYHIQRIFLGAGTEERVDVHVHARNGSQKIGTLSGNEASVSCNIEYNEEIALSHTSRTASVFVHGYTILKYSKSLKDLPGPPVDNFRNINFSVKGPKKCVDPEFKLFRDKRGDPVNQTPELSTLSVPRWC